jgi:hypothetical protein
MPRLVFTPNLERHVGCPEEDLPGATLHELLERYFASHPHARGYLLDEHGAVRKHMVVFVDGRPARDRAALSDALGPDSEVFVFQALSGG